MVAAVPKEPLLGAIKPFVIPLKTPTVVLDRLDPKVTLGSTVTVTSPGLGTSTAWSDHTSNVSSRTGSRDPSPLAAAYPDPSVRGPLHPSRSPAIPSGGPSNPSGGLAFTSRPTRATRKNVSPPEGPPREVKKQRKHEGSRFPVAIYEAKPENFGRDVPSGLSAYQGRAFCHHFTSDRQDMRTVRTGRVAPYHAEYMACAAITDNQKASIDALCLCLLAIISAISVQRYPMNSANSWIPKSARMESTSLRRSYMGMFAYTITHL